MGTTIRLSGVQEARAFELADVMTRRAELGGYTRNVHTKLPRKVRGREAAASELALAIYLGNERLWNENINAFRSEPDVFPRYEVRRVFRSHHRLTIYREDHDWRLAVLAYGDSPVFELRGWITVGEGKAIGSLEDPNGTGVGGYFVSELLRMEDIPYPDPYLQVWSLPRRKHEGTASV